MVIFRVEKREFKGKGFNCNKVVGHIARDCLEPKLANESDVADINSLMLNIV